MFSGKEEKQQNIFECQISSFLFKLINYLYEKLSRNLIQNGWRWIWPVWMHFQPWTGHEAPTVPPQAEPGLLRRHRVHGKIFQLEAYLDRIHFSSNVHRVFRLRPLALTLINLFDLQDGSLPGPGNSTGDNSMAMMAMAWVVVAVALFLLR